MVVKLYENELWLREQYLVKKLSQHSIAKMCECSRIPIVSALKRFNIHRRSQLECVRVAYANDKLRQTSSERAKRQWSTPGYREKQLVAHLGNGHPISEDTRLKISDSLNGHVVPGSVRSKIAVSLAGRFTGAQSPVWKGGISFEPYCPKFNKTLKESIREQYNRTCQKCGEKEGKRKLHVHHVNFDKNAGCYGKPWNLVPLHGGCHAWTTHHRFEAFNLFVCHWALNPEINIISFEVN